MINLSDVVGMVLNEGLSGSSAKRIQHALGSGATGGGGLGDLLGNLMGNKGSGNSGLQGLGGMLGSILGEAGQALGGNQNLALGGLGALAGRFLGGDSATTPAGQSSSGGGGAMALLGALAFKALKASRTAPAPVVPLGLREPANENEQDELEQHAALVLTAMISAAKCDGRIDNQEIERIIGKLKGRGLDGETQAYVMREMAKPLDLEGLCAAAKEQPELAAQVYAASLMAIELDTPAEQAYLQQLADGLGLTPGTAQRLETMVGVQQ